MKEKKTYSVTMVMDNRSIKAVGNNMLFRVYWWVTILLFAVGIICLTIAANIDNLMVSRVLAIPTFAPWIWYYIWLHRKSKKAVELADGLPQPIDMTYFKKILERYYRGGH